MKVHVKAVNLRSTSLQQTSQPLNRRPLRATSSLQLHVSRATKFGAEQRPWPMYWLINEEYVLRRPHSAAWLDMRLGIGGDQKARGKYTADMEHCLPNMHLRSLPTIAIKRNLNWSVFKWFRARCQHQICQLLLQLSASLLRDLHQSITAWGDQPQLLRRLPWLGRLPPPAKEKNDRSRCAATGGSMPELQSGRR